MLARIVDQDAPHRARRNREELTAVDPLCARLSRETQIRLMHHGGRGKRMTARFNAELPMRYPLELAIDQRHETVHRLRSAAAHGGQRVRDLLLVLVGQVPLVAESHEPSCHDRRGVFRAVSTRQLVRHQDAVSEKVWVDH